MSDVQVNKSIYEKIIEKGSLDASEIKKQGLNKAEALKNEIISEAEKEASKIIKRVEEQNQNRIKLHKTNLERTYKREILFKKKQLLDDLIKASIQKLVALSNEDLYKFVVSSLKRENLTGNEIIKVNKNDYSKYLTLFSSEKPSELVNLDKLNKELGNNYQLKLAKDAVDIVGGFIVIGEKYDINFSFESILNIIKENYEKDLANILFKED